MFLLEKIQPMIKHEMENAFKMAVPLDVKIGLGKNWLEAHQESVQYSVTVGSLNGFVISTEEKSYNIDNKMNKIKLLFETKMYLISIIPLLFLIFIDNVAHYGYNKTVGWAFDINGISYHSINFL